MSIPPLFLDEVKDEYIRENFKFIADYIRDFPLEKGQFKFFKIEVSSPLTNFKWPHKLGYQPKDVIQTYVSNGATITWNYDSFTNELLDLDASTACTIRAFVGRYEELNI